MKNNLLRRLRLQIPLLLGVAILCTTATAWKTAAWKTYVSKEGGYIAFYPSSWHTFPPRQASTLMVFNFPFSRAGGGVLPDYGASIAVAPSPRQFSTLDQWLQFDRTGKRLGSRNVMTLRRVISGAELEVTEIASVVWEDGGNELDGFDWYFEISGMLFSARLTYWKGDTRAEQYRQVMREMVERVRLVQEAK